jgi:hypothetical protein
MLICNTFNNTGTLHKQTIYLNNALPMCRHWSMLGVIADRRKGDCKGSVYAMMAAIGRNV